MYNPSRGGVRGGADQFTWESVKTDKHRENYLGHSLKAPVGRWQKGKDLSWYAKERKDGDAAKSEKSELAAIKQAERDEMLIALGHKVARKENQTLTQEEMKEALRRNVGERDDSNFERVDGVGASSRRAVLMTGISKTSSNLQSEGVLFESRKAQDTSRKDEGESTSHTKRAKNKKKSKKTKKEKKSKKSGQTSDSDNSDTEQSSRKKHKKHKKKHKYEQRDSSSDSGGDYRKSSRVHKKHKSQHSSPPPKRQRHDTSSGSD